MLGYARGIVVNLSLSNVGVSSLLPHPYLFIYFLYWLFESREKCGRKMSVINGFDFCASHYPGVIVLTVSTLRYPQVEPGGGTGVQCQRCGHRGRKSRS